METIKRGGRLAVAAMLAALVAVTAYAGEAHKAVTYVDFTGKPVTVAWDSVDNATHYIWRVRSLERDALVQIDGATEHTTDAASFTFNIPFVGHFIAEVKAVDADGNSSSWALSTNDENAVFESSPQGWWIYGRLAPAGEVAID